MLVAGFGTVLSGTQVAAQVVAPHAAGRVRNMDITHVALDLRFDWERRQATGHATITMVPLYPANSVALDAGMLSIASIGLTDGTPLKYSYDGGDWDGGLVVALGRIYQPADTVRVRIAYHTNWVNNADPSSLGGSTGKGLRFFQSTTTEPVKRRQVWSMGEPQSNRYWFPSYDAPDDLRSTEITATVPSPLMVIANGELIASARNPDGSRTFRYRQMVPHANHLTSIVVGEYVSIENGKAGVPLRSFGYPDERVAVEASIVRLADMERYFSSRTGTPYPFASYAQVFVQDLPWGTGSMGVSTLTENMIDDARTHADYFYLWDGLEADALANQWFGAHVTARDWRHAWLNKGLAHYLDALYDEHVNGRENTLLWKLSGDHAAYRGDWNAGLRTPIVPDDLHTGVEQATGNYPYSRAALVMHMLRDELGDALWWATLHHFLRAHGGSTATTADFQRSAEAVSGRSLTWFFDQWMYGVGHPVFRVTKTYDPGRGALQVRVVQEQRPDSASGFRGVRLFQGSVDIAVDGRVQRVWVLPQDTNTFSFDASRKPAIVTFDHEGTWIKEMTFEKSLDELTWQAEHDSDPIGRRDALSALVKLAQESDSEQTTSRVHDVLRTVISGDAHWRHKYTAALQLNNLLVPGGGMSGAAPADVPVALDSATRRVLFEASLREAPWVRSVAISLLGLTRDRRYVGMYREALRDSSHVVNYSAAIALGQARAPGTYETLTRYMKMPSWKGENILCGLAGLQALGDKRAAAVGLEALGDTVNHRWTLAVSRWDYRLAAAELLASLGTTDAAYRLVRSRFEAALPEDDINDIFSNVLLMITLGDARGATAFDALRARYRGNEAVLKAVESYAVQFGEKVKPR